MGGNFRGVKILCNFKEVIILNFSGCQRLIFVGAVFCVYLKSRFLFKVIVETTHISLVIRIFSVIRFLQSLVVMKFSCWDSFFLYIDKSRHGDHDIPYLLSKGNY